jgi:hypothetical protein
MGLNDVGERGGRDGTAAERGAPRKENAKMKKEAKNRKPKTKSS